MESAKAIGPTMTKGPIKIRCQCGWGGTNNKLVWVHYCPKCLAPFKAWPRTDEWDGCVEERFTRPSRKNDGRGFGIIVGFAILLAVFVFHVLR